MDSQIDAVFVSSVNLGTDCIQVYDANSGANIKSYRGNCVSANSLCAVGRSDYLICAQKDKPLLESWMLNQHEALHMRFPVPGRTKCVAVNYSGLKYCAIGIDEKIYLYQLSSGHLVSIIKRHYQAVTCLQFTPCGNYLASAGDDGFIYLWSKRSIIENLHKADRPQIEPHYILGQHLEKVTGLRISSHGMRGLLVTSSLDQSCKIFDLTTGLLRHNLVFTVPLTSIALNSMGSQLFVGAEDGKVWGVNLLPIPATRDIEVKWPSSSCHSKAIKHMCLTTNGFTLITGSDDGEVKLFTIVMNAKDKGRLMTFAFQKSLHVGRGLITNLFLVRVDREIFNAVKLECNVIITPFSTVKNADILSADIQIVVKPRSNLIDPITYVNAAADVLKGGQETCETSESTLEDSTEEEHESHDDSAVMNEIQELKDSNSKLYKLCLKYVMDKKE